MHEIDITTDDIEVEVKSSYRELTYNWEAKYTDETTMFVQIRPVSSLDGTENITVTFIEYKTIRGKFGG